MIDPTIANAILDRIVAGLRPVLRSPARVAPGSPVNLSLSSAAPEFSIAELVNGALNLAWVSKDVIYRDAASVALPDDAAGFKGDDLAGALSSGATPQILGGEHFPPYTPFPLPLSAPPPRPLDPVPSLTNIPGLLGQLFGSLDIKRPAAPKLRLSVRWIVRAANGDALEEGTHFVAPEGLTSPDVSLLMLPLFTELRLDTLENPPVEFRCVQARVALTIDGVSNPAGEIVRVVDLPAVPVMTLPLPVPTVVALGRHHNFEPTGNGATVFVVPEHSPLASAEDLNDELAKIRDVISRLTGIAKVATFLLGLRALNSALSAPYIAFFSANGIPNFNNVKIGTRLLGLADIALDDQVSSVLVFGLPATRVQFFNDLDFEPGEGKFDLRVGPRFFVLIRDLHTSEAEPRPKTFPNLSLTDTDHVLDFVPDPDHNFNDSMSSVRFHEEWLGEVQEAINAARLRPLPTLAGFTCADDGPSPSAAPADGQTGGGTSDAGGEGGGAAGADA